MSTGGKSVSARLLGGQAGAISGIRNAGAARATLIGIRNTLKKGGITRGQRSTLTAAANTLKRQFNV